MALALSCVAAIVALWPVHEAHAGNPDYRMRTLETEHFYIHYYASEEEVADRVALTAERAYTRVTSLLGNGVYLKTHVILVDSTDSANGFANAVPFPRITLFATAPGSMSVLASYDDWIDILVTHEFVHVAHLDTVHGIPRFVNALLGFGVVGRTWSPNILQPRWMVEGLATEMESSLGSQGRYNSAHFDMFLRMAVLEDRFKRVDEVTSGARVFPHGTSVYLYGLHLMHYIATQYGRDKLEEMSHLYGSRAIPFGMNRVLEDVIGIDYDALWDEFEEATRARFNSQARRIRAKGLRQGKRLTASVAVSASGGHSRYALWSGDDSEIYYYDDNGHRRAGVFKMPATGLPFREGIGIGKEGATTGETRVLDINDGSRADLLGSSGRMVFDMSGTHDLRYRWSDLYLWEGKDPRKRRQLTFGARALEPDVSPDAHTVAFARNDVIQRRLAFLDIDTGDITEVEPLDRVAQVFNPRFHPDGDLVVFSAWMQGGYRDIYTYRRSTGEYSRITSDRYMDVSPDFSPDGRYILFSSDRTGVYNLFAIDTQTEEQWQVSNVLGGAFEPAVSHKGDRIAYTGYTSTGFDIWVMPYDPQSWTESIPTPAPLPQAQPTLAENPDNGGRPPSLGSKRYKGSRTFFPRTVFPAALEFESSSFLTDLGLTLQVADVVGFHNLTGNFTYLVDFQKPAGSLSYTYDRLFPTFSIGVGNGYRFRDGFDRYVYDPLGGDEAENGDYFQSNYLERIWRGVATMSVPLLEHPMHFLTGSVSYDFTRYDNLNASSAIDPNAPGSTLPEVGNVAGLEFGLTYSNVQAFRFSATSEQGRRIRLDVDVNDPILGSDYGVVQVSGSYTEFVPMPWRGHQVLAWRIGGGAASAGLDRRGAFSLGGLSLDQDVIRRLLNRSAISESGSLRGYRPGEFNGRYFANINLEYRIPLIDIDRGVSSIPVFFQRVVAVPFTDWGRAWTQRISYRDIVGSIGASLVFILRLGYGERIELTMQYAHGFDSEEGLDYFRAMVSRSF